jgi:hypothetical protein
MDFDYVCQLAADKGFALTRLAGEDGSYALSRSPPFLVERKPMVFETLAEVLEELRMQ